MIEGAPGWPIFGIPAVKAWREDSRRKAGFAGCIEYAAGRPCFSAREPAGHEFGESTRSDPGQIRYAVQGPDPVSDSEFRRIGAGEAAMESPKNKKPSLTS
jgi:hypothetical protein